MTPRYDVYSYVTVVRHGDTWEARGQEPLSLPAVPGPQLLTDLARSGWEVVASGIRSEWYILQRLLSGRGEPGPGRRVPAKS